ncbi:NgoPII family restriction endonuclease [Francisellaceae bacterium CB300]
MSNTLKAIISITKNFNRKLDNISFGNNRANSVGEGLELFVANAFNDFKEDKANLNEIFSFRGSQNHPPDFMLKGGDAIEVKKTGSSNSQLQLNSSHPKNRIYINDPKITNAAKTCEDWNVKDLLYIVGNENKLQLDNIWLVYGDCFVADKQIYKDIEQPIRETINSLGDNSTTKELGRLNNVDPLKVSSLRIRGMWLLTNPSKYFKNTFEELSSLEYKVYAIIRKEKFLSFPKQDIDAISNNEEIIVKDSKIPDPNNPANMIDVKLVLWGLK